MTARRLCVALAALAALAADPATPPRDLALDDLLGHMHTTHGVVAEFHEVKTLKILDAPLESRGTIYFAQPDRFARVTREPAETRLVLDGGRMSFRDAAGGSDVDLSANPVARAFADNLMVLWRGDRAALEAIYKLDFHSEGAHWQLALAPRHSPLDQFLRTITLRGDGPAMQQMEVLEADGDRTQTFFEKIDVEHEFGAEEARAVFGVGATK
jgi:outer membrane lipoprotein-sorting protein